MRRALLTLVILIACESEVAEEAAPPPAKAKVKDPATEVPTSDVSKAIAAAATEAGSWGEGPPYTPGRAEREDWLVVGKILGGKVEVFSRKGEAPEPDLSDEAKGYLKKYGGWLTWSPDAPGEGQWGWEPRETGCGVFMQHDQVANIAIILAGVSLEAHCRLCAVRKRGRWKWQGCTCEENGQLEDLYVETENRLNRDGNRDRFTGMYDMEGCEKFRAEADAYDAEFEAERKAKRK